jgi:hypothetical protein
LDADRTPRAGIEVVVDGHVPGISGSPQKIAHAETGADGIARIAFADDSFARLALLGVAMRFRVHADVPLPEPPAADLGADPRRHAPVELVLPESGSLDVRILDRQGEPVDGQSLVYLFWRAPGSDARFERQGQPFARAVDGVARFPIAPLGMELRLDATGGERHASGSAEALGPRRAGERVAIDLRLGPLLSELTATVVDETGAVRADTKLALGLALVDANAAAGAVPDDAWRDTRWRSTDAQGRLRERFRLEPEPGRRRVLLVEQDDRHGRSGGSRVRRAVVPLLGDFPGGVPVDLGTIRLVPEPEPTFLAEGRVVDADGAPFANAWVSAGYWDRDAGKWQALQHDRVQSGADGRFTVLTELAPPESFTLGASAHRHVPANVTIGPGARDVLLTLHKGGTLSGVIRAGPGVPTHLFAAKIRGPDGAGGSPNMFAGAFGYDTLPGGTYSVEAIVHGTSWVLARIDGVVVPPGGVALDPRLSPIDVSDRCAALRLLVEGPDGEPLVEQHVWIEDEARNGGSFRTDDVGRLLAIVPRDVGLLHVHTNEAGARVAWHAGEQRVRLRPR